MAKRAANKELNRDNWDDEEDEEEVMLDSRAVVVHASLDVTYFLFRRWRWFSWISKSARLQSVRDGSSIVSSLTANTAILNELFRDFSSQAGHFKVATDEDLSKRR